MTAEKLSCPCCGYATITEEHDICPICRWQFDCWQRDSPDDDKGPNYVSLRQARINFASSGCADQREKVRCKKPSELGFD